MQHMLTTKIIITILSISVHSQIHVIKDLRDVFLETGLYFKEYHCQFICSVRGRGGLASFGHCQIGG